MTTYTLPLAQVIAILQEFQCDGQLQTLLPRNIMRTKESCKAIILLTEGAITFCSIQTISDTTLQSGEQALQTLARAGQLDWVFDPTPSAQSSITPSPSIHTPQPVMSDRRSDPLPTVQSIIPRRREQIAQHLFAQLDRKHRRVLQVVDGRRTVDEIAQLLTLPTPEIITIIRELSHFGAIE